MSIETIIEKQLQELNKEGIKDEKDKHCREAMKEYILPTTKQVLKALEEIFGDEDVQCERYVNLKHIDLFLPIIGRIDFESNTKGIELKILPPEFRKTKKGYSVSVQKLPEQPRPHNLAQTSVYERETKKDFYLVYANSEDYKVFKPSRQDLDKNFNNMIEKAKVIQNLLDISNGDGRVMAQYVEQPDLDHWYYSDLTTKQKKLAREIWNIH